jgi:hypothetical protein
VGRDLITIIPGPPTDIISYDRTRGTNRTDYERERQPTNASYPPANRHAKTALRNSQRKRYNLVSFFSDIRLLIYAYY